MQLLEEVIRTLDPHSRAAIALVFIRGEEQTALELLGATSAGIRPALAALDGSLLIQVQQQGQHGWRAKHPTILDAFATLVAEDRELLDIYLVGTPVRQLISEIGCGGIYLDGVKVMVPPDRFDNLITRIIDFRAGRNENHGVVNRFLAFRCGLSFLRRYLERDPTFIGQLQVGFYFDSVSDVNVLNTLHQMWLLPEDQRLKHVRTVRELAIITPDAGFLHPDTVSFLTNAEIEEILDNVRTEFLPLLDVALENWKSNYSGRESAEDWFSAYQLTLQDFAEAFETDPIATAQINRALKTIDEVIAEMSDEERGQDEDGRYYPRAQGGPSGSDSRSIFDDIDD